MNIKLAYDFWFDAYQSLFPEVELFDWEKHHEERIDLLILPGGEDVSLEYYMSSSEMSLFKDLCYTDRNRDIREFDILDGCYDGRLRVNKILGVCRGLQLLNVAFDGSLYPDLSSFHDDLGNSLYHDRVHTIQHKITSNLAFMETVNSLHHQGLKSIGKYTRSGDKNYPVVIATDKSGKVPEIVTWGKDRVLGVQFHPEIFMENNSDKNKFREFCYKWMKNETTILER